MTNNSIQINSYLQNEMSVEESAAFEDRLKADASLRNEIQVQQQIMNAVMNAGIKNEFAHAIRKRLIIKRSVTWGIVIAASIVALLVLNSRLNSIQTKPSSNSTNEMAVQQQTNIIQPFINPPMPGINVPLSEYNFNAEKGDTLYYPSGSIIYFPPSAFVDASGITVKGMVKISYREFADPTDFFVSGIPMQYDSAGKQYNFESSGMCEINAYKDGEPVFVNEHAKPVINLSGKNKSPLHNLYFLDTANRKWEYKGKDSITLVKNTGVPKNSRANKAVTITNILAREGTGLPVKPIKPRMAADDHQSFSIEVEPGSFDELFAYNNLKFEVVDESTYKRSDANEHWETVKLDRTTDEGIYNVTFSNSGRKVSYKVRPVLAGSDYDAALKVFNKKNLAYEQALKNRQVQNQKISDSLGLVYQLKAGDIALDRAWNDKMNLLIVARNKKMRELKKMNISPDEKLTIAQQQSIQDQLLRVNREQWKAAVDVALNEEVIRTFPISNFGVWNSDRPQYQPAEPLYASYNDSSNNKIALPSIYVVNKAINGIVHYSSQQPLRFIPAQEYMLWSIMDSSFYYFTHKDFAYSGINSETKTFTFKMRKAGKPITSYSEIRDLVGKL